MEILPRKGKVGSFVLKLCSKLLSYSGFSGLGVSVLASGTQVCGFIPG